MRSGTTSGTTHNLIRTPQWPSLTEGAGAPTPCSHPREVVMGELLFLLVLAGLAVAFLGMLADAVDAPPPATGDRARSFHLGDFR